MKSDKGLLQDARGQMEKRLMALFVDDDLDGNLSLLSFVPFCGLSARCSPSVPAR
jgi:hypothetical protein